MRQTYTMTKEQQATLLDAMQPVPYMIFGGRAPRSQQENANDAWRRLGDEMGFDGMSVRPGRSDLEFTAEPKEPEPGPECNQYDLCAGCRCKWSQA